MADIDISVPRGGVTLVTDVGLTIHVYRSDIDDDFVVELETDTGDGARPEGVRRNDSGRLRLRLLVNDRETALPDGS